MLRLRRMSISAGSRFRVPRPASRNGPHTAPPRQPDPAASLFPGPARASARLQPVGSSNPALPRGDRREGCAGDYGRRRACVAGGGCDPYSLEHHRHPLPWSRYRPGAHCPGIQPSSRIRSSGALGIDTLGPVDRRSSRPRTAAPPRSAARKLRTPHRSASQTLGGAQRPDRSRRCSAGVGRW